MKTWNIQTIFGIWFGFRDITLYIAGIWDAARKDVKVKQRPAVEKKTKKQFLSTYYNAVPCLHYPNSGGSCTVSSEPMLG